MIYIYSILSSNIIYLHNYSLFCLYLENITQGPFHHTFLYIFLPPNFLHHSLGSPLPSSFSPPSPPLVQYPALLLFPFSEYSSIFLFLYLPFLHHLQLILVIPSLYFLAFLHLINVLILSILTLTIFTNYTSCIPFPYTSFFSLSFGGNKLHNTSLSLPSSP